MGQEDLKYEVVKMYVYNSDSNISRYNEERIVSDLVSNTSFFGSPIPVADATGIANDVTELLKTIKNGSQVHITGSMIRELANCILITKYGSQGLVWAECCTRVGVPRRDAVELDQGSSDFSKENANQPCGSPEKVSFEKACMLAKEQNLLELPPSLRTLMQCGDIHIHDLWAFATRVFCQDYDLRYFLYYGYAADGTGEQSSVASPAKHARVAVQHAVKALCSGQCMCAGGQGMYNFLVFLAPYLRGLSPQEIKQEMQNLVYELTQVPVARGGQVVFSSLQLHPGVPKLWRDKPVVYQGKLWDGNENPLITYGEYEEEVNNGFRALMEVMLEGDIRGKSFNFPKPEVVVSEDFMDDKYTELYLLMAKVIAKHGTPYIEVQHDTSKISCEQCCAYGFSVDDSDPDFENKMWFRDGKHLSMGGKQVITINLPRLAYLSQGDTDKFFSLIRERMDQCVEICEIKERFMQRQINHNMMTFLSQQLIHPDTHEQAPPLVDFNELVYTIGFVGLNEVVQYMTGHEIHEGDKYWRMGIRTIAEMANHLKTIRSQTTLKIGIARTPAESCAQRFAVMDLKHSNDVISLAACVCAKGDIPVALEMINDGKTDVPAYYSNGSHVATSAAVKLHDKIRIEEPFFPLLENGNIFHIFLGEQEPDHEGIWEMIRQIASNTKITYFCFTRDFTICNKCHTVTSGFVDACPECKSLDIFHQSRVTGYLAAFEDMNLAKQDEVKNRYTVSV